MYIKNKLGIYLYGPNVNIINNISWKVNAICHEGRVKFRIINTNNFGIKLYIYKKKYAQKK